MTRTDARACRPIPIPAALTQLAQAQPFHDCEPPHLLAYLASVPDPRAARGRRHRLVAILSLAAAAVLAGARSIAAIAEWAADAPQEVRAALDARQQAPGHWSVPAEATIRRTLSCLDPDAVAGAIGAWLADRDGGSGPWPTRNWTAGGGRRRGSSTGPSWPTWPGRPRRGHCRGQALHPADPGHPTADLLVPALLQPIPA